MKSIFRRSLLLVLLLGWFALGAGLVYGNEAIQGLFVESYDGAFIPGAVRKPGGDGPFPAVLYIHGGLGGSGQEAAKRMLRGPVPEHFHQLGYVGFAADYRRYHFGQDEIQDVLAGYRKLQNLPYVDPTRVAVIGGSHGGYLAQMLVTRVTPAATVSFAGLSDIEGMFYETGRKLARSVEDWEAWRDRLVELKNARNDPAVAGREVERIPGGNSALRPGSAGYEVAFELGWRYRDRIDAFRAVSPKENVENVRGPVMYLVGGEDRLRFAGKAWIEALQKRGVAARYSEHPGVGHGFYWGTRDPTPPQFHEALRVTSRFIEQHTSHGEPHTPRLKIFSGRPRLLVVHGYSTSAHWWAVLQRKINRFQGDKPSLEVVLVNKGGTPIAKWIDVASGAPGEAWKERIRPVLASKGERPAIVLAQQSLQWVFGERTAGIAGVEDKARIAQGAEAIRQYVDLLRGDGADEVFVAMHIYKQPMEPQIGNERLALAAALDKGAPHFHAGPDVWEPTSKQWPRAFAQDKVHPNSIGAEIMAHYWFETLLHYDGLEAPRWSREEMEAAVAGEPLDLRGPGRFPEVLTQWGVPLNSRNPWQQRSAAAR